MPQWLPLVESLLNHINLPCRFIVDRFPIASLIIAYIPEIDIAHRTIIRTIYGSEGISLLKGCRVLKKTA